MGGHCDFFILLFIKVGSREWANENILNLVNILLLINFIAGFFGIRKAYCSMKCSKRII